VCLTLHCIRVLLCVNCLQLSAEQGRVSQLQAENTAGQSKLDNLRSTITELRQQLEGAQASQVSSRAASAKRSTCVAMACWVVICTRLMVVAT
jgi:hypothetical protein